MAEKAPLPVCLALSQIVNGRLNVDQCGKDPADFRSAAAVSAQIQQSFRQLPLALGVNLVVGLLLTALLWQVIDHTKLMFHGSHGPDLRFHDAGRFLRRGGSFETP